MCISNQLSRIHIIGMLSKTDTAIVKDWMSSKYVSGYHAVLFTRTNAKIFCMCIAVMARDSQAVSLFTLLYTPAHQTCHLLKW